MGDVCEEMDAGSAPLHHRAVALLRPTWYLTVNCDTDSGPVDALEHFTAIGLADDRSPNPLFEPTWYRARAGDAPAAMPAVLHYLSIGWRDGLDPGPLFDTAWYSKQIGASSQLQSPLEHYLHHGAPAGWSPHPLFDANWYAGELALAGVDEACDSLTPYEHFLTIGWKSDLDPGPMFDTSKYLMLHRDVASSGQNPFIHYVTSGLGEGRNAPPPDRLTISTPRQRAERMFRRSWYCERYPDVGGAMDPRELFASQGFDEDRSPTVLFDPGWYRATYADIPDDRPALEHYLLVGHHRGHDPSPIFSSRFYRQQVDEIPDEISPLEHYLSDGWIAGVDPHPLFSTAWYVERVPAAARMGGVAGDEVTPYEHFLQIGWRLGADAGPMFRTDAYYSLNGDVSIAGSEPLSHFAVADPSERRRASELIDDVWYRAQAPDDPLQQQMSPIAHFARFGAPAGRRPNSDPLASALAGSLVAADERARGSLTVIEPMGADRMQLGIDWDKRIRGMVVPESSQPRVSVIIPTLDHSEDVVRCIESIIAAADETSYEIVLVDDGSALTHSERFEAMSAVRVVRHDDNRGFAGACNSGVDAAKGEFLLLLNNDTEVLPGWLDGLVAELDEHPTTGVAGSMIVRPDLRLQEAGCIVWSDGLGHQYGNGDSPLDWRYRTRREVDYCSGACLLIRRSVWDRIGGFDRRFDPAYYEDVDLCFAARTIDAVTVYVPTSVVFHNEGSTHGREGVGGKRLQFRNRTRFVEKWQLELTGRPDSSGSTDEQTLIRVRERRRGGHVLIVDHRVPRPDEDAGSLRLFRIIEDLVARGLVVHFLPESRSRAEPWGTRLERMGVEIAADDDVNEGAWIAGLADDLEFVLLSRPEVASRFESTLRKHAPMVPVAFDMVDAHAQRLVREAALQGRPSLLEEAARMERLEALVARAADVVVAVSDSDAAFIQGVAGITLRTVTIPTIHVAEPHVAQFEDRAGLLFVGGFEHRPNVDAALFLALEILPVIERSIGTVTLTLAGSKPPPEVRQLARHGVVVTGWVADLKPHYARSRVVVAPLRFGAGVKGKIGEALSLGVPTVTTTIGIEGMALRPGVDIVVADDAQGLADAVASVYSDADRWRSLSENGARAIEEQFGRETTNGRISAMIEALSETDPRRRAPIADRFSVSES